MIQRGILDEIGFTADLNRQYEKYKALAKDVPDILADSFMTILCVTIIGTAYQMPSLSGIVRSGGDTKFIFYNDFIFMCGLVIPISVLGAFVWHLPASIVFLFLKSDQVLKCIVAAIKTNSFNWLREI